MAVNRMRLAGEVVPVVVSLGDMGELNLKVARGKITSDWQEDLRVAEDGDTVAEKVCSVLSDWDLEEPGTGEGQIAQKVPLSSASLRALPAWVSQRIVQAIGEVSSPPKPQ